MLPSVSLAILLLSVSCHGAPQEFNNMFNDMLQPNPFILQQQQQDARLQQQYLLAAGSETRQSVLPPDAKFVNPTGGLNVETCPNFETPFHTISTCRGVSELVQDGSCEPKVTWSKGSMCGAVCEAGFGFFVEPAPKYSCDNGGLWAPAGKAPNCYEIVPVFSANLQFKITYKRPNIENLKHQFDGLVYKYNDIFCPYPEECGIGEIAIKNALDTEGKKMSEVTVTIDTPVYNITDQAGFIGLVREAVNTVNEDNAFMTLIDYDNIELVLPQTRTSKFKANPMLCCHTCPEGHAYKLGNCVRCPAGGTCI